MPEQPPNLDISAEPTGDSPTPRWQRAMWPAAGVALLAATALVVGHLQRPKPAPSRPLETIVVPGNRISSATEGNRALLAVDIDNIGRNPVTVTNPHLEPGAGVTVVDVRVEPAGVTLPLDGVWSPPGPVVINPMTGAQVVVRFGVDCSRVAFADPQLPIFSGIVVTVSAGDATSVANVTPGSLMVDFSQQLCQ